MGKIVTERKPLISSICRNAVFSVISSFSSGVVCDTFGTFVSKNIRARLDRKIAIEWDTTFVWASSAQNIAKNKRVKGCETTSSIRSIMGGGGGFFTSFSSFASFSS